MVIGDLFNSARERLRDRGGLVLLFGIYVGLLGSIGLFTVTNVATIKAVLITFAMVAVVPALFFLLAAVCLSARGRRLGTWWRLAAVSLPVILTALVAYSLMGRIEASWVGPAGKPSMIFTVLRVALFGIGVPLALIQLWVTTASEGLPRSIGTELASLRRAYQPRSVLTYLIGLLGSGVLVYLLLFTAKIPFQQQSAEVASLAIRGGLALVAVFFGWIVTLTAMGRPVQVSARSTSRA